MVLEADPNTTAQVSAFLASATATDDGDPQPSIANDFTPNGGIGGVGVGNTVTVTWTATDNRGNESQDSARISVVDTTPPALTVPADLVVPASSPSGAVVTFAASASDFASASVVADCAPSSGSTFAVGESNVACTATDSAGNSAHGTFKITVIGDPTPPVVTPVVTGTPGTSGWYKSDVGVSWTVTDNESAVSSQTGCDPSTVAADTAGIVFTCSATSAGGTTTKSVTIKRDATAPTIVYTGNAGTYAPDQIVSITCTPQDTRSGVATSTCANLNAPAWTYGAGQTTRSASATDLAGNTGTGTVGFAVVVTGESLCRLTMQFLQSSAKYHALTLNQKETADLLGAALCQRLALIVPRLTPAQRKLLVVGYQTGIQALVPAGLLTQLQANTLKALAEQL